MRKYTPVGPEDDCRNYEPGSPVQGIKDVIVWSEIITGNEMEIYTDLKLALREISLVFIEDKE